MFFRGVWPLLQTFKLGCSGFSLPTCRGTCSPSFMISQQWTASHRGRSRGWISLSKCGKAHKAASQELGSLSTHPGRLFAALMHVAELDAWAQEGRGGQRVFYRFPSTFLRAVQAWLLCAFRKGLFTLLQAGIHATAPAGYQQSSA